MVFHHNSRYVIWWLLFSMQAVLHVICVLLVYSAVFGSSMCQFLTQTLCSKFVTNCCPECLGAQRDAGIILWFKVEFGQFTS